MSLPEIPELEPVYIPDRDVDMNYSFAVVKDNLVYQVLHTDGQTAALLLSGPKFVQVDGSSVAVGDEYDSTTRTFSTPKRY